jgi:DHA2 family methylenomycin A resistance protein-like MFS transporter
VLAALATAAAMAVAFVLTELRVGAPAIPLRLLGKRLVAASLAGGSAANVAFYGSTFLAGLYAQEIRGASALAAGLMFVPEAVAVTAMNMTGPRLAARFGPRVPILAGQAIMAGGCLGLLAAGGSAPVPVVAALLIPIGAGGGLSIPTVTAVMLENVPREQAGLAGGVYNAARQVASALAVAIFGSLVASRASFRTGMTVSLLIASGVLAVAAVATVLAHRRGGETTDRSEMMGLWILIFGVFWKHVAARDTSFTAST